MLVLESVCADVGSRGAVVRCRVPGAAMQVLDEPTAAYDGGASAGAGTGTGPLPLALHRDIQGTAMMSSRDSVTDAQLATVQGRAATFSGYPSTTADATAATGPSGSDAGVAELRLELTSSIDRLSTRLTEQQAAQQAKLDILADNTATAQTQTLQMLSQIAERLGALERQVAAAAPPPDVWKGTDVEAHAGVAKRYVETVRAASPARPERDPPRLVGTRGRTPQRRSGGENV